MTFRYKISGISTGKGGMKRSSYTGQEFRFDAPKNKVAEEAAKAFTGWAKAQLKGKKGWFRLLEDGTLLLSVSGRRHRLTAEDVPFTFDPATRRVI